MAVMEKRAPQGVEADGRVAKYKRVTGHHENERDAMPPSPGQRYEQEQGQPGGNRIPQGEGGRYAGGFTPEENRKRMEDMICLK